MEQFAEDLNFAKSALSQLFSLELSDKFENFVNEGEFYGEEIIDDIKDEDDSNIIEGLEINNSKQLKLFSDLIIQIFKDHNYNINKYIHNTNNNTNNNINDKYIKDMNVNEFTELIHCESLKIKINKIDKNTLESILTTDNYNGHKFYSTVNQPKHQLKFAKLLKKSNISLGKGKEIWKRIKQRSEREIELTDDSDNDDNNENDNHTENKNDNDDITPQNINKKLIEMNVNEFVNALINEATTNDKIAPKLGIKFNIETCKKAFIDNEMDANKFNTIGKKEFGKICKQATIIAGPANRLYRVIFDKCKAQFEESNDENVTSSANISTDSNVAIKQQPMDTPVNISTDENKIGSDENDEKNAENNEEIDINSKYCIDMTQNEFIEVILHGFQQKIKDLDNIDNVRNILVSNNVDYTNFMSMKLRGFKTLIKELNLKTAQCVGIYKFVTKRIEKERQEYFVPIMGKQISSINESHPQLLDKQQTQKLLHFLEKDKEIDQKFVRDPSKRDLFEKKLILKVPSIKTGDAIVIYNKLHELVEEHDDDNMDDNDVENDDDDNNGVGLSAYIAKLDEIKLSKMAKMVMKESLKKLFEQITHKINKNGVNGNMFINNLYGKNENEFIMFFCQYIHNKCFEFSSDLYLMINNNDNRIAKIRNKSSDELSKYLIDTFIQKIGELIVNEGIDGLMYLELGKTGFCKKLNKYLSFGFSRKLVTNIGLYLDEAYKHTKRISISIKRISISTKSLKMTPVCTPIINIQKTVSVTTPSVKKHKITPVSTPVVSIDKKIINNYSNNNNSHDKFNRLTPRQSLSMEKTDIFEAIIEEEEVNNYNYNNNKLNGHNKFSNSIDINEKEESKSMYSQTLGLSETSRIYSRISLVSNNLEEKELAKEAIGYYQKYNKKSLQQCRKNVYKCDLNKLFPHINISQNREHKLSVSWNDYPITNNEKDVLDEYNGMKKKNLNGKLFVFTIFVSLAKSIYKISDKENKFYRTLYDDIIKENNGFLNILTRYEIQEWLAGYECNRIKYVIYTKHIDYKTFRCISQEKFRDNINYLGFLPAKRRKKLYGALVKFISTK